MARTKQSSKRKRRRTALVLGAAGVSLTMAGGASATAPATNVPSQNTAPGIVLAEEEISDVSLATFYVFDKESESPLRRGLRLAAGHACGGCGGCAAHGSAAGGCAAGGCAAHGSAVGGCAAGGCAAHGSAAHAWGCRGGRGCRGCGCGCAGYWIGGCWGCAGDYTNCWQWDPASGQWVSVCY